MATDQFKIKENAVIARLAALKLGSQNMAIVIGKTIYLHNVSKKEFLKNTLWLKHELCHVAQFRQHGFLGFIIKYLWEWVKHGYHNNKFEIEAREAERR